MQKTRAIPALLPSAQGDADGRVAARKNRAVNQTPAFPRQSIERPSEERLSEYLILSI
jgi:hypothetical protein